MEKNIYKERHKYMNKKVIRLTEEELHNLVKQIIDQSLMELMKRHMPMYLMPQQWQRINYKTGCVKKHNKQNSASGNKHIIDNNDIIDNSAGTEQRANQSLLRPFINEYVMFYAVNRLEGQ